MEIFYIQLELVQVLYGSKFWFDFNLKLRQNLQIEPYPYSDLSYFVFNQVSDNSICQELAIKMGWL